MGYATVEEAATFRQGEGGVSNEGPECDERESHSVVLIHLSNHSRFRVIDSRSVTGA
jgi:hypothetical protein